MNKRHGITMLLTGMCDYSTCEHVQCIFLLLDCPSKMQNMGTLCGESGIRGYGRTVCDMLGSGFATPLDITG